MVGVVFTVKQIRLSQGLYALVNDEDFEWVNQWKWHASQESRRTKWYACRREKGVKIRMHIEIFKKRSHFEIPAGFIIDHVNHNSLDNRYATEEGFQLECITQAENMRRSPGWKRKGVKCGKREGQRKTTRRPRAGARPKSNASKNSRSARQRSIQRHSNSDQVQR